jgi:uncharacterized membrane protein YphA (DoxX/SURF4 family)
VPADTRLNALVKALRAMRDEPRDTFVLAFVRIGFGLLLLNEASLATSHFRDGGYFDTYFHQPYLPEALVPSEGVYEFILGVQWVAAALVVIGRAARPALLVCAGLLVYTMLCDRLWFHHYRHTMAAFSTLLAFTPCDRHLVLQRPPREEPAPVWAQYAIRAQVSVMYLTSGGTKLLDPDWRGGLMMKGMVESFARLVQNRGLSPATIAALESPLGASLLAKGAIATELALAVLLWIPRTRRLGLWVGLFFHLSISLMTPVQLFTAEMLLVYLLFATPDAHARTLRFDPKKHHVQTWVSVLDWLRRFRLEPAKGATFTVVDRDGAELTGARAAACIVGALPITFPAWPLLAVFARMRRPPGRQ